jgi:hypothetical protein
VGDGIRNRHADLLTRKGRLRRHNCSSLVIYRILSKYYYNDI